MKGNREKIEVYVEVSKAGKERSPASLLFLLAGIYGILHLFQAVSDISFTGWSIYVTATCVCTALWYVLVYKKPFFWFLLLALLAGTGLILYAIRDTFPDQFFQIVRSIAGRNSEGVMPVTSAMMIVGIVISLLFFVMEIMLKCHFILYLVTTILLLGAPFLGVNTQITDVILLGVFQIAFWSMQLRGRKKGRMSHKSVVFATALFGVCILVASLVTSLFSEGLFHLAFEAEGYVYRSASRMSGLAAETITGGRINQGNNYYTGAGQLELTEWEEPTEPLYLKGFSGGTYVGSGWLPANDEALFAIMEEKLGWGEWGSMLRSMYYGMYFVLNNQLEHDTETLPMPNMLNIRHLNDKYDNAYVPYYGQRYPRWADGEVTQQENSGYIYAYYQQADMDVHWDQAPSDFEEPRDWYRDIMDAYVEEIQTAYTQPPKERLPRLSALVEENPMENLDEISAFILYTLHNNTSYTLTPGWAPLDQDIAEYFLFESGRGYCEHYALTATLMYRLYGIPARYCTGYMVQPSQFEVREDGRYVANVTDESSHAWTEIFLEDYGWTPVEVTPSLDGSTPTQYPGFDNAIFDQLTAGWNLEGRLTDLSDTTPVNDEAIEENHEQTIAPSRNSAGTLEKVWWCAAGILLVLFFMSPFLLDYQREKWKARFRNLSCREVFYRMMKMLHKSGRFLDLDGTEEEFVDEFVKAFPQIQKRDIQLMYDIVQRAAYGCGTTTKAENEFVRSMYALVAACVCDKNPVSLNPVFMQCH